MDKAGARAVEVSASLHGTTIVNEAPGPLCTFYRGNYIKVTPTPANERTGADGGGTVTTSALGFPWPLYKVDTPVPLSEIQNALVGDNEIPQGFFRLGSVLAARPGISETRLVWITEAADQHGKHSKTSTPVARVERCGERLCGIVFME
jgi:hypothetical protein